MPDRDLLRTIAIAGFCLALPIYNWHYIIAASHRAMTLLVLSLLLSGAIFYELTVRGAPMEWVLGGVSGVMCLAALAWIVLHMFVAPLANDHAPLLPARNAVVGSRCPVLQDSLRVLFGGTAVNGAKSGPVTPFRVGSCPGPTVTRTGHGVLINAFGYDDDGTVIYGIRDNQFELLQGDYLHLHRTDRSTLALYDKWENEILYLRYIDPRTVRVRGRFLCGETSPVTVSDDAITIGDRQLSQPPCSTLGLGPPPDIAHRTP